MPPRRAAFLPAALVLLAAAPRPAGALPWMTGDFPTPPFVNAATSLALGPDGRLYVAQQDGLIYAFTLGPGPGFTAVQTIGAIQAIGGRTCLGIGFDPFDPPDPVRLYVSHTRLEGDSLYPGTIARLTGPSFATVETIVTGLPIGKIQHATNGFFFGTDGQLYICNGSNSTGGVPGLSGGYENLPDSPLSAALLRARVRRPGFDGIVRYDQYADPGTAVQIGGFDVEVFAPGLRNPYDACQHSNGLIYATDNGLGESSPVSTSCVADAPPPVGGAPDELDLIEAGNYYGQPNRLRGRTDPRQCVYRPPADPPGPGFTQPLLTLPSSTDGIAEYYPDAFGGAMRGDLLCAQWTQATHRVALSADGRTAAYVEALPASSALDVEVGPDGTVYFARYEGVSVGWARPDEAPFAGPHALSVFPRMGPLAGGRPARVVGTGFGTPGDTKVELGGRSCVVDAVTPTAIDFTVPPGVSARWVDLRVAVGAQDDTLARAYRYLVATDATVDAPGQAGNGGALRLAVGPTPARSGGGFEVSFSLPAPATVELRLFDLSGRERARIVPGALRAGPRRLRWETAGLGLGSGVYFIRLRAGQASAGARVLLLQ